jgi:hypothetical protein
MPTKIKELPKTSRGREKKYDFTKLYDGSTWVIVQGEDFDCEVQSIRQLIYREVAELNKSVKSAETTADSNGQEKPALAFKVIDEPPKKRGPRKDSTNGDASKDEAKS